MQDRNLIDLTVTSGHAFGGDLEAVGPAAALLAARVAGRADVVVVDLADTVSVPAKNDARRMAAEWLTAYRRQIIENRRLGRWVCNAEGLTWRESPASAHEDIDA